MNDNLFILKCGLDFNDKKGVYCEKLRNDGFLVNSDFYSLIICDPNSIKSLNYANYFDRNLDIIYERLYETDTTDEKITEVMYLDRDKAEREKRRLFKDNLVKYLNDIRINNDSDMQGWNAVIDHLIDYVWKIKGE